MRRGQSSIEAVIAAGLLSLLVCACAVAALHAWRGAERDLARLAARGAERRGGDAAAAARRAVPGLLRPQVDRWLRETP